MEKSKRKRVNVLGLAVDAIDFDAAVARVVDFAVSGETHYVCVASVQDIVLAQHNARFRRIMNQADLIAADGWPVFKSLKRQGFPLPGQVTGPDLMLGV